MSYYYRYNFISPEVVYSTVKEELKSYFDTGAIDDLLFPTYTDKCLRKLGRSSYVISEIPLEIQDFEARLPDNFYAVREAWMCTEIPQLPYQTANSFYSQAGLQNTIQVSPVISNQPPNCTNYVEEALEDLIDALNVNTPSTTSTTTTNGSGNGGGGGGCGCGVYECNGGCGADANAGFPEIIQAVYKTNYQMTRGYKRSYLLKPGNISAKSKCDVTYTEAWKFTATNPHVNEFTPHSAGYDSFDIRDNKLVTNFRNGIVHLVFYALEYDDGGNQMIPDNYRIREYIEAFIKYKIFETLSNQINDETFEQIQKKLAYYKQLSEEAFIMADIEIRKQDVYSKQRRIKQDLNRFNMYELPNRIGGRWRRNGNQ
jgi:hypothetical protein